MIPLLLVGAAWAGRPTDGSGLYAFDDSDRVESLDGPAGRVRVHYSVEGPNQVREGDADGDGLPDFAQDVALRAEEVLVAFEAAGLRPPLSEAEMGLSELGGSGALDFYLVDFNGTGDGQFGLDTCRSGVCSGYMVMENDFRGYGYGDLDQAIRTLTSHELFHGVQYAYLDDLPAWMSEGTAMWAELLLDPDSEDFKSWCGRYLSEPDRGLDRTPAGAFTGWEYGTGLFFGFLHHFLGQETNVILMEQLAAQGGDAALGAVVAAIEAQGSDLEEVWTTFARWNLQTGRRAGAEGYPYAAELDEVEAAAEGDRLVDDERIYPLASVYLYLSHRGGPLYLGFADDPTGLHVQLLPSQGGVFDPLEALATSVRPNAAEAVSLGDWPEGGLWLILTQPRVAEASISVDYCLGGEEVLADCGLQAEEAPETSEDEPKGCGCSSASGDGGPVAGLLLALAAFARRRRAAPDGSASC